MARFDKSRTKGAKADAAVTAARPRRRQQMAPAIEDTMFFPRLRRHAKWMFVLLAAVFALGFVGFGVGAGGVGVGNLFQGSGGGGASVSDARKKTEERPNDPEAWQDLATAYQADGDTASAVDAQTRVVALRPKDPSALRELAALHFAVAADLQQQLQQLQATTALRGAGHNFPRPSIGGVPIGGDAIGQAVNAEASGQLADVSSRAQQAINGALDAYRQLTALQPNDPSVQLELAQAAIQAGDAATAIAAYERFLVLAPDDASAPDVRRQLKQLRAAVAGN
jgi:tetratricopeptide (TPR) repeat protein